MPPRLGMRKSRKGCKRCKARKVKCDEALPSCGWCRAHDLKCEYSWVDSTVPKPNQNHSQQPSPPSTVQDTNTPSLSVPTPLSTSPNDSRHHLFELALLHYYITQVVPTFPNIDPDYWTRLYGDIFIQEALRSATLLNAMFAYALLHMHIQSSVHGILPRNKSFFEDLGIQITTTEENEGKTDLLTSHRNYFDRTLHEQRNAIIDINANNADGTCLSAVLVGMIVLVHESQKLAMEDVKNYTLPLQWFRSIRSFSACLHAARPFLHADSAIEMLIKSKPIIERPTFDPAENSTFLHLLEWQPRKNREAMDEATVDTYQKSLALIQYVYKSVEEREPWEWVGRKIMAFPNLCPQDFATFLEQERPRAMVMLAHLIALAKPLNSKWWIFNGVADYHVKGIAQLVPAEWQWAMNWPLEKIEKGYEAGG